MILRSVFAGALLCLVCSSSTSVFACDVMRPCYGDGRLVYGPQTLFPGSNRHSWRDHAAGTRGSRRHIPSVQARAAGFERRGIPPGLSRLMAESAGRVVSHPAGCPARAFCGCGAAVRVFGRPIRSLWLAANWFRFPRTSPAPGTVAVRRHHVFVLEEHIGGSVWRVYDANSGGHRTRIHPRSIAGFVVVDPRA